MIILFANQKGGCGKTTNCIQFANFLTQQGKTVFVLDCDFQRSIYDRRQDDLKMYEIEDGTKIWDVEAVELDKLGDIIDDLKTIDRETYILVDMPGKVDDKALFPLFNSADYIVVPFQYDKVTIDSTGMFINLIKYIEAKAPLLFLPNRVKKIVKYEDVEKVNNILSGIGKVLPEINDRVAMEKVCTLYLDKTAVDVVSSPYTELIGLLK